MTEQERPRWPRSWTALLALFVLAALPLAAGFLVSFLRYDLEIELPGPAETGLLGLIFVWPFILFAVAGTWLGGAGVAVVLAGEVVGMVIALESHGAIAVAIDPSPTLIPEVLVGTAVTVWAVMLALEVFTGIAFWARRRYRRPRATITGSRA